MRTTTPARRANAEHSSDEKFLALVCSEEDLLRAEFDAIIAAAWPDPPSREPHRDRAPQHRPRSVRHRTPPGLAGPATPPRPPGTAGPARQRSPPARPTIRTDGPPDDWKGR